MHIWFRLWNFRVPTCFNSFDDHAICQTLESAGLELGVMTDCVAVLQVVVSAAHNEAEKRRCGNSFVDTQYETQSQLRRDVESWRGLGGIWVGSASSLLAEGVPGAPGHDDDLELPQLCGPRGLEGSAGRAQPAVDGLAVRGVLGAADRGGREGVEGVDLAHAVDADEGELRGRGHGGGEGVGDGDFGWPVLGAGGEGGEAVAALALPAPEALLVLAPGASAHHGGAVAAVEGARPAFGPGPESGRRGTCTYSRGASS
jgi:hypothetical protein